jgi:riboflavin transporter FmnP
MKSLKDPIKKLTFAGLFLALCMVLPLLTGQIPQIGMALSPMHIPVLLCGFVCGWQYGLTVGFIAPFLRFAIFGMPQLIPMGISMAFELAAYGLLAGLLYKYFPKKVLYVYVTLILSMIGGRIVWGAAMFVLTGLGKSSFSFDKFLAGAVVAAVPGIILHIVLIPLVVIAMKQAKLILNDSKKKQGV